MVWITALIAQMILFQRIQPTANNVKVGIMQSKDMTSAKKIINNDDGALILYVFVGISILIIGVVIFMIFQSRRKDNDSFEMV